MDSTWNTYDDQGRIIQSNSGLNFCNIHEYGTCMIRAEDIYRMVGMKIESTTDAGGGSDKGYIDNGDWMEYQIVAPVIAVNGSNVTLLNNFRILILKHAITNGLLQLNVSYLTKGVYLLEKATEEQHLYGT